MKTKEEMKAIADRLKQIAEANGGRLTPEAVVADAKRKDSPLHAEFEWDTRKAALAHWIDTARRLIASVNIVVRTERIDIRVPAYVRDPSAGTGEQGYVSVATLRNDADSARDAIVSEFKRVGDMLRRARNLATALEMEGEVDRIIASVTDLRERFEQRPSAGH
jgi:hypothetical protein